VRGLQPGDRALAWQRGGTPQPPAEAALNGVSRVSQARCPLMAEIC